MGSLHLQARLLRNPKHPKLVKAHNWVIMGDLAPEAGEQPWTYLPTASRLYLRKKQLPAGESFRTKNELAAEMLRQLDQASQAPVLGIFDGGYAGYGGPALLARSRKLPQRPEDRDPHSPSQRCPALQAPDAAQAKGKTKGTGAGRANGASDCQRRSITPNGTRRGSREGVGIRETAQVPLQVDGLPMVGNRSRHGGTGVCLRS